MGHDVAEPRIHRFVEAVYDAAVAPEGWPRVLAELAAIYHGAFVDIFTRTHDRVHFSGLAHGLDAADYQDTFLGVWFRRNVWGIARPVQVAGDVLSTRSMVDPDDLRRSEIYAGYLCTRGLHEGLRLSLWAGENGIQDVSILRPWSRGAFGPAEVALGQTLLPHLQRAAAVTRRFREVDFKLDLSSSGAAANDYAVFAFDAKGTLCWLNAVGDTILAKGTPLRRRNGELHADTAAATETLRRAVAQAVSPGPGTPRQGARVALPRATGSARLTLTVVPMSNALDWAVARPPAAVAFLRDRTAGAPSLDQLRATFAVTRAEAELAHQLLAGSTLREVANRTGRSMNTLRSHLARLMDKTETSKQIDLIRLLGDLASVEPSRPRPLAGFTLP